MAKYGSTWWGKQWLNALERIDNSNRLPRGRAYAGNGSVRSIEIGTNEIVAKVKGSAPKPYNVTISVPSFTTGQKEALADALSKNAFILSKILNRELPQELLEIGSTAGVDLFPRSWRDVKMNCSCPDYAVPCKHIAAIIYLIANEIDRNPFLVFSLHGFDLIKELGKLNIQADAKEKLKTVMDLTMEKASIANSLPAHLNIDFSSLTNIKDNLLTLLSPDPLFYHRDFKTILSKAYNAVERSVNQFLKPIELFETTGNNPFSDNESAIALFDVYGHITHIKLINENAPNQTIDATALASMLRQLEEKNLPSQNEYILGLNTIFRFSLNLLTNAGFIPQIIATPEGEKESGYAIRWIPAIQEEKIQELVKQIAPTLPTDLAQYKVKSGVRYQNPEEQVASLCSMFLNYFVHQASQASALSGDIITDLFFASKPHPFSAFSEKETPNTIQLWLNKFYITHRDFVPVLKIEEEKEENSPRFQIEVMIENRKGALSEMTTFQDFLKDPIYKPNLMEVLKDLSLLADHFPDLKKVIQTNGQTNPSYNNVEFVDILLKTLPTIRLFGVRILLPKSLKYLVKPKASLRASSIAQQKEDTSLSLEKLLKFNWQVALGDDLIDPQEFLNAVKGMTGLVKIKDQYIMVNPEEMKALMRRLSEEPVLTEHEKLQILLTEEFAEAKVEISASAKSIMHRLMHPEAVKLPKLINAKLRPYQLSGYEWLYKNSALGFGSLIADDMGLGKTLQVITSLLKFKEEGKLNKKKALVVVPTSLLTNWVKEIEKFAPGLTPLVYHGGARKFDFQHADLVITTYGTVRSDLNLFEKEKWYAVILDEAQNIKNAGTDQTKAIKKLKAEVKIAMTGTPVENRLSEYWSIFDFINKGYLGSAKYFNDEFSNPIHYRQDQHRLEVFKKITRPFILRRLKSDKSIINDLPDKVESDRFATLTKEQTAIYQNIVDNILKEIAGTGDGTIQRKGLILKLMTALKQICNHPYQYLKSGTQNPDLSGKLTMLLEMLGQIMEAEEKVLIFTQYREMGEILSQAIKDRFNTQPIFLHGGCSRKQRDEMVTDFQTKKNVKVFILSLKAGGTGLNLTEAANVIHYDLWWNPAVEAQATDRAYRIGQKKNVMVHRFITQGTFEEKIDLMLKSKKALANLTVESGENWIGELSNAELKELVSLK